MANDSFANTGEESFKLKESEKPSDKVVLNIEEEEGIISLGEVARNNRGGIKGMLLSINRFLVERSTVKIHTKATFFHLLSVMINSGVPMVKALRSLALQQGKDMRMQMIITRLADGIESGSSLSKAMLIFDDVFTTQEIGMIQAGEASGQLARVLARVGLDTEKVFEIRSKVKSAMMYPLVVFSLLIAVIFGMMVFVVPKLTQLFDAAAEELPLLTRVVIIISDFMVANKLIMVGGVLAFIGFIMIFKKTDTGSYLLDLMKIRIPVFGKLFRQSYLSRFARSISNLTDSRISIVRTMEITAESIGNEVYKKKILLSREDIKQGIPLAESLMESDLFPPMMVNMIEVGEQTAQLDEVMAKVADFYEQEVDNAVAGISKLIEPIILIVIGVTVGLIVAAIMLPIMRLSEVVSSGI